MRFPDLKASRRDLLGQEIGTQFDWGQRLFAYYGEGDVFDYGEWNARDMKVMFSRDGVCSALELVLTLPIREADIDIVPAKGDKGEAALAHSVLMTPDQDGGCKTPMHELIGQITSAQIYRRSFFEKVWKIRESDGKIVYDKIAYRPPSTCQARYNDRTGEPNGFRQQVWLFGGNLMLTRKQKVPGYVDIPRVRSYVYTHGKHREPLIGVSEMEVSYWNLAHGTAVQTPDGPMRIEDIRPGDFVIGSGGIPTRVRKTVPCGPDQMFRVTLQDGSSVECGENHMWGVRDRSRKRYRVMTVCDIMRTGLRNTNGWRFSVPLCAPAEYPERDLPVDPYVLGAWLGDGSMQRAADGERRYGPRLAAQAYGGWVADEIARRLPPDMQLVRSHDDYLFVPVTARDVNPFRDALVALGVNKGSSEKFIPELYLQASVKQRLDLLRGLMDTDGSVTRAPGQQVRFYTSSGRLAAGVRTLIRSLGGTAALRSTPGRKTVWLEVSLAECPFLLPEKSGRWTARRGRGNTIISIERTEVRDSACIVVEAEDHLFAVNDYVLTRNCYQTKMKLLYLWYHFLENQALQRIVVYGNDQPEANTRADDISQLRGSGVVGIERPPDGQKAFEVIPAEADAGHFFLEALGYLESWQVHSVLAGFMALTGAATGGRGSYAMSQDQSSFYLKSRQAIAKEIAESFNYGIMRPLSVLNFGSQAAIPQLRFGPLQDEQAQALLTLFGQMSAAPVLHVPVQVFDLITERMASILQLDVDQVHDALTSTASQRAEQLSGNPPPGIPAETAGSIGQLQGLATAATGITRAAAGRAQAGAGSPTGAGSSGLPRAMAAPPTAAGPPQKPAMTPPPGRMA